MVQFGGPEHIRYWFVLFDDSQNYIILFFWHQREEIFDTLYAEYS